MAGGAEGAGVGAAAIAVAGPIGPVVGALVGAHVGSLYSFNKMKGAGEAEEVDPGEGSPHENLRRPRQPGMLIAVAVDSDEEGERALATLRQLGAQNLEQAEGRIVNGDWEDFDPLSIPVRVA